MQVPTETEAERPFEVLAECLWRQARFERDPMYLPGEVYEFARSLGMEDQVILKTLVLGRHLDLILPLPWGDDSPDGHREAMVGPYLFTLSYPDIGLQAPARLRVTKFREAA